jgi:hypothetical protein
LGGYAHASYAASLAEFGRPFALARSGGWLLERSIPGSNTRDAVGCYPLFSCADWSGLRADLAELDRELVSVVFVADPFGNFAPDDLAGSCNRGIVPFKQHYVIDLTHAPEQAVCSHHRRNARKAARSLKVEHIAQPEQLLDEWCLLYQTLVRRHEIRGISAFSRRAFAGQLATPGLVAFRAEENGATVGMLLWYVHGEVGYYHLAAYSERGYELSASFALFWEAITYFRGKLSWLNIGAGAGTTTDYRDGLTRFKAGWGTHTRTAYLCRHVVNAARYEELCDRHEHVTDFFPAYRTGEFSVGRRAA